MLGNLSRGVAVTPIRRQYLKIKGSYPDAIVLFRLGDFYEAFDEDAHLASRELEITLTGRSMGKGLRVPMAGVPAHALDTYLARLIKKGHKVAICEQLSDPATSRGLVERDVVRVVTPGTVLESALLDQKANNYLAAVVLEGPLAGLAYVDVSTGEFATTQLPQEQLLLELERIAPAEILVPRLQETPQSVLVGKGKTAGLAEDQQGDSGPLMVRPFGVAQGRQAQDKRGEIPPNPPLVKGGWGDFMVSLSDHYHLTPVAAAAFDLEAAQESLLAHYGVWSLESFGCADLPLAVRAAGAIVRYLEETQKASKPQLASLHTYSTAAYMTLDPQTRRNLELFQAGRWERQQLSLLAALDLTRTPMGGRLLRRWVGQPLLDLAELNRRLDAVGYFYDDAFRRANTLTLLAQVPDLERILSRVRAGTAAPRELVSLKKGLEAAACLGEQLENASSTHLSEDPPTPPFAKGGVRGMDSKGGKAGIDPVAWLRRQLVPVPQVVALIDQAIAPEPVGQVGEGTAIRDGFSAELDDLKRASSDARQFIAGLEKRERGRTGVKNLKVGYNQVFGYYIEVSKANLAQVPSDYIRRQTLVNGERFIVPELKEYESLVMNARERIAELERDLYRRVCAQIGEAATAIGQLAVAVAQVDGIASLAEVAVRHGYVRPRLDLGNTIVIKDGRHPVVERVLAPGSFVPNDLYLSNDDARIIVLTGPNMSGKSTFIRQVALIALMAQMGSFVPAAEATIGLVDRIFTRVGLQDDLTTGQSTFMVEMVETAAILNQATPRSLVILDEIGRGTSTYDGLSIARSVLEHLHNDPRLGCKTLFATHYHELTELAHTLPGVRNFSVAVAEEDGRVVFLRRIVPGGADRSYGVHVAQLAGLPRGVVNRAWEVLADLERRNGAGRRDRSKRGRGSAAIQMPLLNPAQPLLDEVLALDIPNLTPLEAINKLYELQEKVRRRVEA